LANYGSSVDATPHGVWRPDEVIGGACAYDFVAPACAGRRRLAPEEAVRARRNRTHILGRGALAFAIVGRRLSARAPSAKIYIGRASATSTDARENLDPRRKADVDRLPREGTRRSQRSRESQAMILASRPHSEGEKDAPIEM
jgi:hypothetical protein